MGRVLLSWAWCHVVHKRMLLSPRRLRSLCLEVPSLLSLG